MPETAPSAFRLDAATAAAIETPAVVVDLERLEAAIDGMASVMADRGVALRPHAKTHKSLEIGRRQVAAGASGLTVGTLGEAEVFAAGGLDDLFIAYPVVASGHKASALAVLAGRARLRLGMDSVDGARAIATALGPDVGGSSCSWRSTRAADGPGCTGRGGSARRRGRRARADGHRRLHPRRARLRR